MATSTSSGTTLVRCSNYQKTFCVCVRYLGWHCEVYLLNLSSENDNRKNQIEQQLDTELNLAFNHHGRHRGDTPTQLPLITECKDHSGTCYAAVDTVLFRFGGAREKRIVQGRGASHSMFYFDCNRPEANWKKGPRTITGRFDAATVSLDGKIYVFGGCPPTKPTWAEVLDTSSGGGGGGGDEVDGGWQWSALPVPSDLLGLDGISDAGIYAGIYEGGNIFATGIYEGKYAGNILVGSTDGHVFMYNVVNKIWTRVVTTIDLDGRYFTQPIVVGSMLFWVSIYNADIRAFDLDKSTPLPPIPIGDLHICRLMDETKGDYPVDMNPILLHLSGDLFSLVWVDSSTDDHLHSTTLRILPPVASVVCCHTYSFQTQQGQEEENRGGIESVDCLQPSH